MRGALVGLLLCGSGAAFAHAHLTGSSPADGSHLSSAPAVLVLDFSEAAQLTALTLEKAGGASEKLARPAAAAARIRVPLPRLAAGAYVVHFRTLAADGHMAAGEIHFTVAP